MTTSQVLREAVLAVQHDMDATGLADRLGFDSPDWDEHGFLRVSYQGQYSGQGLHPDDRRPPAAALELIADLAQEVIVEQEGRAWPTCSVHGFGLHPRRAGGTAVWTCDADGGHSVAAIGELPGDG